MDTGKKPLKIINAAFSKNNGGLEQATLDYAGVFQRLGYDVTLLLGSRAPFLDDARKIGCHIHLQTNCFGYRDLFAVWQLRQWLKRERPDAVVAHGNRAISLLRKAAKGIAPVIAVIHTISVKHSVGADRVIAVNAELKDWLLAKGHKDASIVHYVPNMINVSEAQYAKPLPEAPRQPPVIGAMVRFVPEKGLDILIDALAILKRRGIDFRVRIGGDGALRPDLEALAEREGISDRIEFLGWVRDKQAYYDSLDVFCHVSRYETFGIVMIEAMQHKVPVISTDTTGAKTLSEGREVRYGIPIENAEALANALAHVFNDWQVAKRLAAGGFALVTEKYDVQVVSQQLKSIIEEVAKRK